MYANQFNLIIEKGQVTNPNKIPSESEINAALIQNSYQSCRNLVIQPSPFQITVCGAVNQSNINNIQTVIQQAWQTDTSFLGGVGSNSSVTILIQNQTEYFSDDV